MENITLDDAKNMSNTKITIGIGKSVKILENLGMEHTDACNFISSVISLGVAFHEKK